MDFKKDIMYPVKEELINCALSEKSSSLPLVGSCVFVWSSNSSGSSWRAWHLASRREKATGLQLWSTLWSDVDKICNLYISKYVPWWIAVALRGLAILCLVEVLSSKCVWSSGEIKLPVESGLLGARVKESWFSIAAISSVKSQIWFSF